MIRNVLAILALGLVLCSTAQAADRPPNIVFMMSDELAYYELSHMGNPYIKTPRIDRFAQEGIRFTQALAGSPVCAPLRCNLMTGKHAGHELTDRELGEPYMLKPIKEMQRLSRSVLFETLPHLLVARSSAR